VLRRSELRSFTSMAAVLAYGRRWRPGLRVSGTDERYLSDLVTCVTRRYVARLDQTAIGRVRWYNRHIVLYVFAKEVRRLARTRDLRASADVLIAALTPALRNEQQGQELTRRQAAPATRRARNRFLVRSSLLLPVAAALGEVNRAFPGVVYDLLAPLALGGLVHAARRKTGYRNHLPWVIAIPAALAFDLLLHTGVFDAAGRFRLLALLTTHYFGWTWWVFIGQLAYGLLCLTVALRVPWTRARLAVAEALDRDDALPGGLKDDVDQALTDVVVDRPSPATRAHVARHRTGTPD